MRITGKMPDGDGEEEGRGRFGVVGYLIAAIVALAGGAWLALHLSTNPAQPPVANASPAAVASAAAAPSGPLVALSKATGVQVTGDSAAAPERNQEAARKFFEDHKDGLLESYSHALAGDSTMRDAIALRIRVLPGGNVDAASVRTSTNAESGVRRGSGEGRFGVEFPAVQRQPGRDRLSDNFHQRSRLEGRARVATQLEAGLTEPDRGAGIRQRRPASPAASEAAGAPSPAPVETPAIAVEPAPAPAPPKHHRVARRAQAAAADLAAAGQEVLGSNPRTRRVDCYTSGSTVTIFGKVFDANAKLYTEKIVREVPGVGNVIDSLTTDESEWAARQAAIASQLYAAGLTTVTVKVIGHDAYLGGTVKTDAQKQQAVTITESASPVHVRDESDHGGARKHVRILTRGLGRRRRECLIMRGVVLLTGSWANAYMAERAHHRTLPPGGIYFHG